MSSELPVFLPLKFTPRSVIAGHPKQLNDLLASGVASAIVKCKKDSSFFECLLRCPTLAPDVNLPVYISMDVKNHPLTIAGDEKTATLELPREGKSIRGILDEERDNEWVEAFELAMSYWAVKMEEAVKSLYPDRTPKQIDPYARSGSLELPVSRFQSSSITAVIEEANKKGGFATMKLAYAYIGSKEDPRSRDHVWGMKFEFGQYGNFPPAPRNRKVLSAEEKQEQLLKKRKSSSESKTVAEAEEEVDLK